MEEIIPNCISRIGAATGFTQDFKYLYLVPAENRKYGALLFENNGFGGKMQMFMPNRDSNPVENQINLSNTASMYSFALNQHPDPSWSVTLYAEENSNYLVDAPCMKYTAGSSADSGKCQTTNISWIQSVGISPKYSVVNDLQGKSPESLEKTLQLRLQTLVNM